MDTQERIDFADLVAQAVVDRIEQARNINMLVEMVLTRMAAIQREQDGASSPAADAETSD
jgi:hypothetical protein